MINWLDGEIDSFPSRASGEDLYEYFEKLAERAISEDREGFISTMVRWLRLRAEPKTMIAVEMVGKFQLKELKGELEDLLLDVINGKVFKPFYERPIRKSLAKI